MPILFRNISKTFTKSFTRKKIHAVKDLSLSVPQGEIFGIIGPNGAGKSTTLKMLMNFIWPDSGEILLMGKAPSDPESRLKVGYLPENPYFYDHLSAEELMRFSAVASGMPGSLIDNRIEHLLNIVGLQDARKRKLRSYSKGMTQRAGICFALVHDPDVVILDEPMSGLDPLGRKMVVDLILDLKTVGKTVLFCSHILSDVERICDRMAIMAKGRLQNILEKKDLLNKSGNIRIMVDRSTGSLYSICRKLGCDIFQDNNYIRIESPREYISELLTKCQEEKIKIITMDTTVNTLEQIFIKTVEGAVS